MTTDELAYEALQLGSIEVDLDNDIAFTRRFWGKQLGCVNKGGYKVFTLHLKGQRKQIKLHRLLWMAKNGLPPTGSLIDHVNRNKLDNRIENLRLADASLNAINRRTYNGIGNPAAKINHDVAEAIRQRYTRVRSYRKIAKQFRVSPSPVAQIIRRERWVI